MKFPGTISTLAALAIAITACTYAPGPGRYRLPDPYLIAADFDAKQAQEMLRPGENSIRGSALIRQSGGGVVTCAGGRVSLIPATQYANERTAGQFPAMHDERGFSRKIYLQFDPDERAYAQLMRHTSCDAQGYFDFQNITDGTFYVRTSVSWRVADQEQGGLLVHRVTLKQGDKVTIVLAP